MKLYELGSPCKVRLLEDAKMPPAAVNVYEGQTLQFDHVDGMYSLCYDQAGQMVHPAAWTEVEVVNEAG